jgi:hypothetical protein
VLNSYKTAVYLEQSNQYLASEQLSYDASKQLNYWAA